MLKRGCRLQIESLAQEAGPLIEALPKALVNAVRRDKVPADLRQDVVWLASRVQPHVRKLTARAAKLPEKTAEVLDQADRTLDKAAEVRACSSAVSGILSEHFSCGG